MAAEVSNRDECFSKMRDKLVDCDSTGHIFPTDYWVGPPATLNVRCSGDGEAADKKAERVCTELITLFEGAIGATFYDGVVTQLQHALQSAALAASEA
eukprot:CAMPEP_0180525016 /NCGR_PEP_ID=MMETSP1036_2-20121128/58938_1 /TAXON_ID=632150 /ORGANISM="Azadinium spinosum, Strain 3D9" /LENGTH=97 /DNA_ID=CAMNT_0022538277 /DNA_START=237 /DNA_END=527 /DNA_ORIENTATION=-